jgi:hypothetical protein
LYRIVRKTTVEIYETTIGKCFRITELYSAVVKNALLRLPKIDGCTVTETMLIYSSTVDISQTTLKNTLSYIDLNLLGSIMEKLDH